MKRRLSIGISLALACGALAACTTATNSAEAPASPSATSTSPSASPTPEPTSAAPTPTKAKTPRGALIKQVGERAWMSDQTSGAENAGLTITNIEVDPASCTGKPVNGHFVVLSIDASVEPGATEGADGFYFSPSSFVNYDDNGKKANDVSGDYSSHCFTSSEELSASISPGEKVSGKITLDVPNATGWVGLTLLGYGSGPMWEWRY